MKGKNITALLGALREQKEMKLKGGIYHKTQIDLTYNSNHIEGSRLTHDQTRYIFDTNTIGVAADETLNVNDIVETVNHFRCIDLIIDKAEEPPSEELCKTLHGILKSGTSDSRKDCNGYLTDTCLSAQDQYKAVLDYFRIKY